MNLIEIHRVGLKSLQAAPQGAHELRLEQPPGIRKELGGNDHFLIFGGELTDELLRTAVAIDFGGVQEIHTGGADRAVSIGNVIVVVRLSVPPDKSIPPCPGACPERADFDG